jgi:hypothetical protein
MKKIFNSRDLDKEVCVHPDCKDPHEEGELVLNASCHIGQGLTVAYHKEKRALIIDCAVCGKHVVDILVEKGDSSSSFVN